MDDLDSLSNDELRQYLLQCGFPNTPITDTTRKILIKRLRNHLNKKKTQLKKQILSATRFSSDEESDIEQKNLESQEYKRRTYNSNFMNNSGLASSFSAAKNSSFLGSHYPAPTASSSSVITSSLSNNNNSIYDKYKTSPTSRIYVSPTITYQDRTDASKYQNNNQTYDASDYSDEEYNPSLYNSKNNSINSNNSDDNLSYRSNFTRRLLNLRSETLANNKVQQKIQTSSEQNNLYGNFNHHLPSVVTALNKRSYKKNNIPENAYDINLSPSTALKNVIASLNEHYGVQPQIIPCTLVSLTVIFFVFLSFLYINITPNLLSTVTEKNVKLNICKLEEGNFDRISSMHSTRLSDHLNSVSCIYKNQVNEALEIIKFLIPILQDKAQNHFCKDQAQEFSLNSKLAISMLYDKMVKNGKTPDIRKITHDFHNAEYLIENNPQWQVNHVNGDGQLLPYDRVVNLRANKENYYAILNPSLPLFCSIYNKLQKFFFLIGTIALVLISVGSVYALYKIIVNYRRTKEQTIFHLIEEIISNLITKAERTPNEKSIVVNHLRDMLIPVHKRKDMEWAWSKAISHLEQNESRVVFEMGVVNGEDCQMIKWIDTVSADHNLSSSENRKTQIVKKWESPAFIDKTNKIRNPPTPCLKIRQMFDKTEANDPNLTQVIHDAILEKVGLNCKIYDIQIDKQSCCVYVHCASEQDAGMVHDEINGWWFDKRLVSIKFLRLERYLTRFPNSSSGPKCLYPSNSKKLSISNCSTNLRDYSAENDTD